MNKDKVYIFLFDGFADWEIAYLSPHIVRTGKYRLSTFSKSGTPVLSMGGLAITPDGNLSDLDFAEMAMLVLPGGDAWERKEHSELAPLVKATAEKEIPLAAICAATGFLANEGLLDQIRHTSNSLEYLEKVSPSYRGQANFLGGPNSLDPGAVQDGWLITASGTAPLAFAREIFSLLQIYSEPDIAKWYRLFTQGIWQD
jgi:putative intracellular protease/amidase